MAGCPKAAETTYLRPQFARVSAAIICLAARCPLRSSRRRRISSKAVPPRCQTQTPAKAPWRNNKSTSARCRSSSSTPTRASSRTRSSNYLCGNQPGRVHGEEPVCHAKYWLVGWRGGRRDHPRERAVKLISTQAITCQTFGQRRGPLPAVEGRARGHFEGRRGPAHARAPDAVAYAFKLGDH